ncbi:hypothetical protein BBJ28_00005587 [Nothophytophthora sp. Chile5]|nr:hypothetical protein BBJ28_00005587 [Nothophytophthora sp. Chile5]
MATPLPAAAADAVRVYVGGLPADATAAELRERFGRFVGSPDSRCELQSVTLLPVKGGVSSAAQRHRGFAYLTLRGASAAALAAQLEKTYHRTKWRGSVLRVESAKPSYLAKLQAEWQEARSLEEQAASARTAALETLQPTEIRPLKLAAPFAGRRRTQFDPEDALSAEIQELEELEEQQEQQQETDTEASGDEQEASSDEQGRSGDEEEALAALADGEDDVEAFVRQVEAEEAAAQALEVESEAAEREEANAKRLAALAAKQQRKQQQPAVALAVGSNKKITFDDSGNEQEPEEPQEEEEEEEEEPAVIANWMDSSDDEAEGDGQKTFEFAGEEGAGDADASAFALRPEFLGARGKKLFELQKRFGGDSRFRLDARFLEEEADEFGGNDVEEEGEEPAETDELQTFLEEEDAREAAQQAREMREEEAQALRVVALLYPDVDVARLQRRSAKPKDPLKEAAWMGQLQRYDPRNAHARRDFELSMTSAPSLGGGVSAEDVAAPPRREEKPPPTGGDRFFATSGSLGSLFSRVRTNSEDGEEGEAALDGVVGLGTTGGHSEQQEDTDGPFKLSSLFAFSLGEEKPLAALGEQLLEEEDDAEGRVSSSVHQDVLEPELVATDSEHDEGDDEEEEALPTPTRPHKTRAKKSLQDFLAFGRSFRGPEDASADVDASAWPERRKKLTLDYKRKRRDALKSKKRQHRTTPQRASEPKRPRV